MKKLLKSEICGSCEQCTGPTDVLKMAKSQNFWLLFMHSTWTVAFVSNYMCKKKKKKKKKKENVDGHIVGLNLW